jgi:hypothetical protein
MTSRDALDLRRKRLQLAEAETDSCRHRRTICNARVRSTLVADSPDDLDVLEVKVRALYATGRCGRRHEMLQPVRPGSLPLQGNARPCTVIAGVL